MRTVLLVTTLAALSIGCGGSSEPTGPSGAPPGVTVASVTLENMPTQMETGTSKSATATPRSAAGTAVSGRTITWSSSDNAVATVAAGTITAISRGTVTITATADGQSKGASVNIDTRSGFLTAIVESVRAQYDLPALAAGIVTRSNGVFGAAVSGRRRASQTTPVTMGDLWHIGSNLKAITAHVAGIAVTEGKINWTTTMAEAYPELSGSMRAEYRDVTLRQLLGHTGGMIPNINTNQVPAGTLTAQRAAIAKTATQTAASPAVGTYNYSNVGFMVAANMVERALGISWEETMQTRLLGPLGATAFGWGPTPTGNPVGHQRSGTTWSEWPTSDNPPFLSSAGRSHWSLESYGKVLQEIMKADQGQSTLVTQAVARVNTTSQSSANYGSGWAIANNAAWASGRGVEHDGSNNLNYARTQVALDRGVAVMAVTNSHDTQGPRSNNAMADVLTRLWAYYATYGN